MVDPSLGATPYRPLTVHRRRDGADWTVVIPTWRRPDDLRRCLMSIERQTVRPKEVVVVARAVDEPALAITREFDARWCEVHRPGHVAPLLAALPTVMTTLVAIIDDDAEADEQWLERLGEPFADPDVACVGGPSPHPEVDPVAPSSQAGQLSWFGRQGPNIAWLTSGPVREIVAPIECNWAWRTEVLRDLEFDPVFDFEEAPYYGIDLTMQARERGMRVLFNPAARVAHRWSIRDHDLDRDDVSRWAYVSSRAYTYLILKHYRGLRRVSFVLWWTLVGQRSSHGIVTLVVDLVQKRTRRATLRVARSGWRGKLEGARLWRQR